MSDGSRHFIELPATTSFARLREHAATLDGCKETDFLTDWVTEVWLDFNLSGHNFTINNQMGDYWFFVENPDCPKEILGKVREHFLTLLEK